VGYEESRLSTEFRAIPTNSGPLPSGGEGIWRCLSLMKLSSVELLDSPWRTEPHAHQRCVENIEVDADDYPGGDPQNGQ
jgi:hypothetical protein